MDTTHNEAIRQEFTKQVASFSNERYTYQLDWIIGELGPRPEDVVLDVAAGTGHIGRAIAAKAHYVVAMDLTDAMLRDGKAQADTAGIRNILFELGDAAHLPYLDASFDLITARFALHHFEDPRVQLAEMVRVCRPGGRIGIVDMIAATPDADITREHNRLERLRDQTHIEILSLEALTNLLEGLGMHVVSQSAQDIPLPVEVWLASAQTPEHAAEQVRSALRAELANGPLTGMRPVMRDSDLWFLHLWAVVVASKPAAMREN